MSDLWRFFECANPSCESKQLDGAGVVLQIRMPVSLGHRVLFRCPVCSDPMQPDGEVLATESGHLPGRTSGELNNPPRPRLTWRHYDGGPPARLMLGQLEVGHVWASTGWVARDHTSPTHEARYGSGSLRATVTDLRQRFLAAGFDVDDATDPIVAGFRHET